MESTRTKVSTKNMSPQESISYEGPTLDELIQLSIDFDLISDIRRVRGRIKIRVREEYFDLNDREAGILVRGLLLGSFALHTRDDVSLDDWKQ